MFTVISKYNFNNVGICGKISGKLFKGKIDAYLVKEDEIFFISVAVRRDVSRNDYKKIVKLAGRYAENFICSDDVKLCDELENYEYNPNYYYCKLAINTAAEVIRLLPTTADKLGCLYIDRTGSFCDDIESLIPYCGDIKVVTDNLSKYRACSRKYSAKYGVSIIVSDSVKNSDNYHIVIAPRGVGDASLNKNSVVFISDKSYADDINEYVYDYKIDTAGFENIVIDGVDQMKIVATCYDFFETEQFAKAKVVDFNYNGKRCDANEIADTVARRYSFDYK